MKQTRTRKLRRDGMGRDLMTAEHVRGTERRNDYRYSASQHAAMRFRNANMICDLVDLSETGAKIRILDGAVPNIDERVVLTLFDGTPVDGHVSWIRDKHIGIEFRNPVMNVDDRLDFEDLGSAFFGKAVTLQKSTRRS
jgi:hypothetical protein